MYGAKKVTVKWLCVAEAIRVTAQEQHPYLLGGGLGRLGANQAAVCLALLPQQVTEVRGRLHSLLCAQSTMKDNDFRIQRIFKNIYNK